MIAMVLVMPLTGVLGALFGQKRVYLVSLALFTVGSVLCGTARSLEWATSCPPPRHNFDTIPRIRSESPAFDLHHPEIALAEGDVHNENVLESVYGAPEVTHRDDIVEDIAEGKDQ